MNNVHYHYTQGLPGVNRENKFFFKKMKRPAPREADLSKNVYENRKNAPSYAGAFGSSAVFSAEPCAICSVKVKQLPRPGSLVTLISSPRCFIIS